MTSLVLYSILLFCRPVENTIGVEPGCGLWRRYSEFELLRNYLMALYPYVSETNFYVILLKIMYCKRIMLFVVEHAINK